MTLKTLKSCWKEDNNGTGQYNVFERLDAIKIEEADVSGQKGDRASSNYLLPSQS